jgi:hypothetical protein
MGHEAELVGYGNAHTHLAEVDSHCPHASPLPSTIPKESWPPEGSRDGVCLTRPSALSISARLVAFGARGAAGQEIRRGPP